MFTCLMGMIVQKLSEKHKFVDVNKYQGNSYMLDRYVF